MHDNEIEQLMQVGRNRRSAADEMAISGINNALASLDGLMTDNPRAQEEIRRAASCLQAAVAALKAPLATSS